MNENNVRFRGRNLYSVNPKADTRRRVSALSLEAGTLYLVPSPLLGYGLPELVEALPSDSRIFAWEANPELRAFCLSFSQTFKHPQLQVSQAGDFDTAVRECTSLLSTSIRRVRSISLNGARILSHSIYMEFEKTVVREMQRFWRNRSTLLFMAPLWTRNILENLGHPETSIRSIGRSRTVVVCGAGASLVKALPFIAKSRTQLFVMAVDTALTTLSAVNIFPDLVVVLESQVHNLQDFIGVPMSDIPLAMDLTATPQLRHKNAKANVFSFASFFVETNLWSRLKQSGLNYERIPALGSVGITALYLSRYLDPSTLILCGLDFSFAPGLTHARESPAHRRSLRSWHRLSGNTMEPSSLHENSLRIEDGFKNVVYSDAVLKQYHEECVSLVSSIASRGVRVVDLRDTGLELPAIRMKPEQLDGIVADEGVLVVKENKTESTNGRNRDDTGKYPYYDEGNAGQKAVTETKAEQFFKHLHGDLIKLASDIRHFHQNHDENAAPALLRDLQNVDFLFFDMPDKDWPNLQTSALARALIRVEGVATKIDLILRGLKN